MSGLLDVFQKEPGVYITEAEGMPAPPTGVPKSLCGAAGVTQWGPFGATQVTSFAQWKFLYGGEVSTAYPAYKQVKKFFQNGGTALYFARVAHYTDPTDPTTITAVKAAGFLYDSVPTASTRGASVASGTNAGDEGAGVASGTYSGTVNGSYKVKVTTAGISWATSVVSIYFTPTQSGVESLVGTEVPVSATPFLLANGVSLALTDGGNVTLALNDYWTIAVTASGKATGDKRINVFGKYEGALGNSIQVKTLAPNNGISGDFNLEVWVSGVKREFFADLSVDIDSSDYFEDRVNTTSQYITLEDLVNPQDIGIGQNESLFGGNDGTTSLALTDYAGDSSARTGIRALGDVNYPMALACWDIEQMAAANAATGYSDMLAFCDQTKNLFFSILVVPKTEITSATAVTFQTTTLSEDTTRGAIYYGFCDDEDDGESISPTGAIMGVYASFADNKGIWYSPAGESAKLLGFTGITNPLTSAAGGVCNENRINVIKDLPGFGICIWGSRTMTISKAAEYKYIGQRRNTSDLESRLYINTLYGCHKPNNQGLWNNLKATASSILRARYKEGGLSDVDGAPYEVVCDATTNNLEARQAGIVAMKVGIRNHYTSEFVWIDITQTAAGATIE